MTETSLVKYDHMTDQEIDALVADRVMGVVWDETRCRVCGWTLATEIQPGETITASGGSYPGCVPGSCSMRPHPVRNADAPARYSSDLATAMLVVERMNTLGWRWHLSMGIYGGTPKAICSFNNRDLLTAWSEGLNTAKSISIAALRALDRVRESEKAA